MTIGRRTALRVFLGMLLSVRESSAEAQEYHVGAGDVLSVQVFDEPRLSGLSPVPSGCAIDVELIGSVSVCGRTTPEIAAEIQTRLANGYLVHPNVIVEVSEYRSQKVEVRGAVKKPGLQYLTGPTTLSQAITAAGGPDGDNVVEVELVRADGTSRTYTLSKLTSDPPVMLAGGDTVDLRQGRHVYVDGEVKTEGPVNYREGLTVSQAVTLAGGPSAYASTRRVFVLHADGKREVVNLNRVREGKDPDVVLGPDDRVTLRRSLF